MASIAVLLIILGCAVLQYLKGTVVRAFAAIMVAISSLIAAFSFFELLAGFIVSHAESIANLAQPISFALLFIIIFAVLQTLVIYLTRDKVNLGLWPERIGRAVCGLILGFIVSGVLVTALAMAPLPPQYPYERFDPSNPKPNSPTTVLMNVDGFVTNLFSTISNGSLSGKKSFATLHPDYLNQVFLNRLPKDVSIITSSTPAITVPIDKAVWPAPDVIKTQIDELNSKGELFKSPGRPVGPYSPLIVRIGIKRNAIKIEQKVTAGKFTTSQLRLICKRSNELQDPLSGKAINVYPVGYLSARDQVHAATEVELNSNTDFGNDVIRNIDFVFCVPNGYTPVLAEFKLNSVAQILQGAVLKDAAEAPSPATFYQRSQGQDQNPGMGGPGMRGGGRGFGNRGGGGFPNRGGAGNYQPGGQNNNPQNSAQNLTEGLTGMGTSDELGN